MENTPWTRCALALAAMALLALPSFAAAAQDSPESLFEGLTYRLLGPAAGGRVSRVTGVPGDPLVLYAATAAGGVWKSVNGGDDWEPIFDDQPISSTGSIAVSPSDPNVVYVGSGEANIRGNVAEGNGIYKSTDGGDSWQHVWKAEGQIGTMVVHPRDPDIAFAAVLGSPFGPSEDRGVYRTRDGGSTWQRVLYQDPDTGASDVCLDPSNPRILFAGLWQTRRTPWGMTSGGPGSGLLVSRDGGDTWKALEDDGLPDGVWGRVGVRIAPSDPDRVYALIEAEEGGLFRSDDGGGSWERINASRGLRQRAWYYSTLTIDPKNADIVFFPQVPLLKTIDGGRRIENVKGGGWDYHDVWIDPDDSRRLVVASDAGVSLSRDGGKTWRLPPLPIAQFYHLSTDTRRPYRVLGSLQDKGTVSGPSNSLHEGGILLSDWHPVGGGEAGHVVADPSDPQVVWAGEYLGFISRWDERTGQAPNVGIYPENGSGHPAGDLRYRFQWTSPIAFSPHDSRVVYHAANVLFRTTDSGQTWEAISPDLTRDDRSKQQWAGGPITGDNTGVEFYNTIFALAESPLEAGVIWAGSDDGLVHLTRDAGQTWQKVTPRALPEWATVSTIEASRWHAGTAYVVADAHRLDDERPFLWKTSDYGASWTSLAGQLDPEVYLHVVREDKKYEGMLYLGTERGVLFSRNDGGSWQSLDLDLPTVAVVDLAVHEDDLVVGTLGRSAYIFDDLTPVREMSTAIAAAPAHLFAPLPAVRWHFASAPVGSDDGATENPFTGALLTYYLAEEPEDAITIEVLDKDGEVIRHLSSEPDPFPYDSDDPDWWPETENEAELTSDKGLNRTSWDLEYEGPQWIPDARTDSGAPVGGPLAPPGSYTLRLTVGEATYEQALTVEPDPRSRASQADLEAQHAFLTKLRDGMTRVAELVAEIRAVRSQLQSRGEHLAGHPEAVELLELGQTLSDGLFEIEGVLHNPAAEVSYDVLAGRGGGAQLYSRLAWLFELAWEHDGPPTQGMEEVGDELFQVLQTQEQTMNELLANGLAELDALAKERNVSYVIRPEG